MKFHEASIHVYSNESKIVVGHTVDNEYDFFNMITKPEPEQQQEIVTI